MTLKELIFNLWKTRFERKGIKTEFKPLFTRYVGVESAEYNDILKTLVTKAREDETHCVIFDREIPLRADFGLINSVKQDLCRMDIQHLSTQDIKMFPDPEVNQLFLNALEYTVNLAIKNEPFTNESIRNDFITKIILNVYTYVYPLNLSLDYDGTYKCFYYGNISRRETYFLILLYLMTFDVIVINPLKDEYWDLTDTDHLSEKITYSMIQEIRTLNERIANATLIQADESLTLHFEHQMDAEIYNNSGLYKAWQLRGYHVKQLLIRGNMIDISNNWNEPAKVRNGFDVKDKSVTIPHSFTVIDGITMDSSEYKSFVTGCTSSPECFTAVQKQDLLTNHMTENDSLQLTFFQLGDGTIDTAQLKEASFYPFAPYNDATEQFILDKMNELIRNPKILKTEQLSKKEIFQLVSTILNISKPLQRMIDNFDFSAQIPKLVYFLEDDKELDNDSCIILAYLNSIGFDIVVLSPAGTAGLETYLDENYFTNIRLGRMKYDVKYSDMKYTAKKSKGFLAKLFG